MAEIQLSGISTGIDTKAIVDQLMAVEGRRLQNYQLDLSEVSEKDTAMGELKTGVSQYKDALSDIYRSSQLKSFNASSADDDYITANASSNAAEGTYSMQVKQLATSDRWIHDGMEYRSSLVGSGDLILSYGDTETVVSTTSTTTLDDLVGLINNNPANEGVTASILQYDPGDGDEYHLVLTGQDSGSDYQITISSSTTEVLASDVDPDTGVPLLYNGENAAITTKLTDLDNVTDGPLAANDKITIVGTDHYNVTVSTDISVNQYTTIEDLMKEIEDAYNGTAKASYENGQIKLTAYASGDSSLTLTSMTFDGSLGSGATMTLPPDLDRETAGGTAATLSGFEATYFTEMQSAQDSKIKVDGYPPDASTAEVQTMTSTGAVDLETFTLTYQGHTTAAIEIDANDATTLSNIQTALNNLDNLADDGSDLTVGGDGDLSSGAGSVTFTFKDSAGNTDLIAVDTSSLTGSQTIIQTTQGSDGWLPTSGNVFSGIDGVSMNLQASTYDGVGLESDTSSYNEIQISISRDIEALEKKIEEVKEKYNAIIDFKIAKASYDPETKEKGVLYGDYTIAAIFNQLKDPFNSTAEGFTNDDTFFQPSDIGITINSDGKMEFDKAEFSDAIAEDYSAVLEVMGAYNTGRTDSSNVGFYGSGTSTKPGVYDVKVFGNGAGVITAAWIKTNDETWSEARAANVILDADSGTYTIVGDDTYYAGEYAGYYENPEANLTLTVQDPSAISQIGGNGKEDTGGLELLAYVKQGFAGESKSLADELLQTNSGRIAVARSVYQESVDNISVKIESEQRRLEKKEDYLILKFARLEKTLSMLNQQMSALQ